MNHRLIPAALALAALAGCANPEARIKDNPAAFTGLMPEQQALVRKGEISLGMPEAAVQLALGRPDRVTEHTDAGGITRIWHYTDVEYADTPGAYPWYPYAYRRRAFFYDPFLQPGYYPAASVETDRVRVVFKDGKVSAIERET
jgi:hypothetical protein